MKKTLLLITVSLITALSVQAQELTLDEILKSHFKAIGQDKLLKVKSLKMKGKQTMQGMEFPFTVLLKRPGKMRADVEFQGTKIVQAFNGEKGYMINPMTGSSDPQDISEDQQKDFKDQSDMDGKLFKYKEKGHTLELVGIEEIEGTEVYNLKLTEKSKKEGEDGNISHYYLDAESFVILKTSTKKQQNGAEMHLESFMGNYKMIDGMAMAHSTEMKVNGNPMMQMTIEEVLLNEEMADELFEKPEKKE